MMVGYTDKTIPLCEHLHKLVSVKSEQDLENLLKLLWQTRKIGLSPAQKASLQTLLNLPSPGDLGPVLASLRSLIRNCAHKNSECDDILKLLPPDLPLELQRTLLISLQKHQSWWNIELSQEQHVLGQTGFSQPITAERNISCFPPLTLQNDIVPHEIMGVLPRVKSMTWTVENKSDIPANRVAIVTLKLQEYTKSPPNEMEVKFQLTRDILEAVLRSMVYINQQLSRVVGSSSAPLHKKQRQY